MRGSIISLISLFGLSREVYVEEHAIPSLIALYHLNFRQILMGLFEWNWSYIEFWLDWFDGFGFQSFHRSDLTWNMVNLLYEGIWIWILYHDFDGLVHGCSISIAYALEILQSCTKPSLWHWCMWQWYGSSWCPGSLHCQVISRHGIELIVWNIPGLIT